MTSSNGTTTLLGAASDTWTQAAPYLPMSAHLILSALFPIYTGSHASLSRPSSARSPPPKRGRKSHGKADQPHGSTEEGEEDNSEDSDVDSDGEDEANSLASQMEGLSPSDALLFPLLAGCMLGLLYLAIQYAGPALLNRVLGLYFSAMATFSVAALVGDGLGVAGSVVWPGLYVSGGRQWRVRQRKRRAVVVVGGDGGAGQRSTPLPGWLGAVELGSAVTGLLWEARGLLARRFVVRFHLRGVTSFKARLALRTMVSSAIAVGVVLYATLVGAPWYLTNLQGFAFSYTALQLLSPTTFTTGSLLLVALFFYDIYFVFYTPLMVTVATNLDVPIKLLIPRPAEAEGKKPGLAMLGLGDIVIPGIMIGLSLRFDLYLHYLRQQRKAKAGTDKEVEMAEYVPVTGKTGERLWTLGWTRALPVDAISSRAKGGAPKDTTTLESVLPTFAKTYFYSSIIGYTLGMGVTLSIMGIWGHAQPALLYLVPGVLGSIWGVGLFRGEISQLWNFTELVASDESETNAKQGKDETKIHENKTTDVDTTAINAEKGWFADFLGDSFFGMAKNERNSKRLEAAIAKTFQEDEKNDEAKTGKVDADTTKKDRMSFIGFSIYPAPPRIRKSTQGKGSGMPALDGVDFDGQNGATTTSSNGSSSASKLDSVSMRTRSRRD